MCDRFIGLYVGVQCNILNADEPSRRSTDSEMPQIVGETVDKEVNEEPEVSEVEMDTAAGDEDFHCGDETESEKSELEELEDVDER